MLCPLGSIPSSYSRAALENPAKSTGEMAYTRNLIGALAQSGSKLKGMDEQPSIFFIFHDLSFVLNISLFNPKSAVNVSHVGFLVFAQRGYFVCDLRLLS
jgi:hypothetical protein